MNTRYDLDTELSYIPHTGICKHDTNSCLFLFSGSEVDSDEDLDLAEEEDIMELEEGDKDYAGMDKEKLRDEVGRVHLYV